MDVCNFEQTVRPSLFINALWLCGRTKGLELQWVNKSGRVRYGVSLMPVRQTGPIHGRDDSPFPRAQEYRQAWCLVIPRTTGLFGLRLLSVYRFRRLTWRPLQKAI